MEEISGDEDEIGDPQREVEKGRGAEQDEDESKYFEKDSPHSGI